MKIQITFFLLTFFALNSSVALVPIEGVVYGEVEEVKQFDPFVGMLNASYVALNKKEGLERAKLTRYFALYKQGNDLADFCEKTDRVQYANKSAEDTAIRSTVANLQYLGLDFTIRSIANYTELLEFPESKYKNLYTNLINNSCSQNITVFSHKMLKANFKHFRLNPTGTQVPSITDSPYFAKITKSSFNTREEIERSLYYSLRNFRSLCSWNGGTDSFGLLSEYVKNPFLMSYVFSNMLGRKINIDTKTEKVFFDATSDSVQVACENLICRRRSSETFFRMFPTLNGSLKLEDDLKVMYCNHFQRARRDKSLLSKEQISWTKNRSKKSEIVETMNLIGQITGVPDMMMGVDKYSEVASLFKNNIKERWDNWAKVKSSKFNTEQLYEESLEVTVADNIGYNRAKLGEFQLNFNIELGEIDKLLGGYDKVQTTFSLEFPQSYISDIKRKITFYYNTGRFKQVEEVKVDLISKIDHQLELKKKYFTVALWNERMGRIIASELIAQFIEERYVTQQRLSQQFIKIPINFHFGVFALQYINDKNKFQSRAPKILTFKQ